MRTSRSAAITSHFPSVSNASTPAQTPPPPPLPPKPTDLKLKHAQYLAFNAKKPPVFSQSESHLQSVQSELINHASRPSAICQFVTMGSSSIASANRTSTNVTTPFQPNPAVISPVTAASIGSPTTGLFTGMDSEFALPNDFYAFSFDPINDEDIARERSSVTNKKHGAAGNRVGGGLNGAFLTEIESNWRQLVLEMRQLPELLLGVIDLSGIMQRCITRVDTLLSKQHEMQPHFDTRLQTRQSASWHAAFNAQLFAWQRTHHMHLIYQFSRYWPLLRQLLRQFLLPRSSSVSTCAFTLSTNETAGADESENASLLNRLMLEQRECFANALHLTSSCAEQMDAQQQSEQEKTGDGARQHRLEQADEWMRSTMRTQMKLADAQQKLVTDSHTQATYQLAEIEKSMMPNHSGDDGEQPITRRLLRLIERFLDATLINTHQLARHCTAMSQLELFGERRVYQAYYWRQCETLMRRVLPDNYASHVHAINAHLSALISAVQPSLGLDAVSDILVIVSDRIECHVESWLLARLVRSHTVFLAQLDDWSDIRRLIIGAERGGASKVARSETKECRESEDTAHRLSTLLKQFYASIS